MKLLIAGDFVPRNRTFSQIERGDYSCLEQIKPIIQSTDYAIVNLESPVVIRDAKPIEKTGPNIKCTEKAIDCVARVGFQCVTLANNHFRDYGQIGVEDTIDACEKCHIDYVGGGKTQSEAEQVLYKNINGQTLAIINCCEHEWSIATTEYGGSNSLDIITTCRSIQMAKQKADFVLVIVHGGTEGYNLPTPRMKNTYRFFVEYGADAVINHHQHCYSGYELHHAKPIFYGIGNLCFDINNPHDKLWNEGFAVEIDFSKNSIGFRLFPYIQCSMIPQVQFLDNTVEFENNISRLNKIISNDTSLREAFQQMAKTKCFLQFLEPYNNKYSSFLRSKGLLPSFLSRKKKNNILEVFRCESHRDIMLWLLR